MPHCLLWQIISIIVKNEDSWLASQHSLVSQLRRQWGQWETFQERAPEEHGGHQLEGAQAAGHCLELLQVGASGGLRPSVGSS